MKIVISELDRITQLAKALYADKCQLELRIANLERTCLDCKLRNTSETQHIDCSETCA